MLLPSFTVFPKPFQANGIHITEPGSAAGHMKVGSPVTSTTSPDDKSKSSPVSMSSGHQVSGSAAVQNPSSGAAAASTEVESIQFSGHSGFAKSHMDQVAEKLQNKMQALTALKSSLKPESKILQQLQNEISVLEAKGKEVRLHMSRTEAWAENLGNWRCHVQSVDHPGSGEDKENLHAILIIYLPAAQKQGSAAAAAFGDPDTASKTSWTCARKVKKKYHNS